jgi:hypothetical protein
MGGNEVRGIMGGEVQKRANGWLARTARGRWWRVRTYSGPVGLTWYLCECPIGQERGKMGRLGEMECPHAQLVEKFVTGSSDLGLQDA